MNSESQPSSPIVAQDNPFKPSVLDIKGTFTSDDIKKQLGGGPENPLEWLASMAPKQPAIDPAAITQQVEAQRSAEKPAERLAPAPETQVDAPEFDLNPQPVIKGGVDEPKPAETPTSEEAAPAESSEDVKPTKEENFRIVRSKLKETTEQVKAKEQEVETLKQKIQKYESGEEVAEPIKEKLTELEELERYRQIHSFKSSKLYQEAIVQPMSVLKKRLGEMAADYEIPEEVMSGMVNAERESELNRFLSNHFDELGALEAKQLIVEMRKLSQKEADLQKTPDVAIQQLEESNRKLQDYKKQQAAGEVASASKAGWIDALLEVRAEGKAKELIPDEQDPDHSQKIVEPVLKSAATQYGKLVKMLAENGLEKLPKDLAKVLAKMVQLSAASAISIDSRNSAVEHARTIEENTNRTTRYLRPPVGGSMPSGAAPAPQKPLMTPESAAAGILNKMGYR